MSSTPADQGQNRRLWRRASTSDPIRLVPKRRARNRSAAALGVFLLVIAGLTNVALYTNAGHRTRVLAVRRAVPAGAKITQDDLAAVQISADPKLQPIPASQFQSVVGQVAKVGLVPLTLLTKGQLASRRVLPAGSAVVGVLLKPGQAPPVEVGDSVIVVAVSPSGAGTGGTGQAIPGAQVFAVDPVASSGDTLVSLVADQGTAGQIAAAASSGSVSLILLPGASG